MEGKNQVVKEVVKVLKRRGVILLKDLEELFWKRGDKWNLIRYVKTKYAQEQGIVLNQIPDLDYNNRTVTLVRYRYSITPTRGRQ